MIGMWWHLAHYRNRFASAEVCRGGGSCRPCDLAHFTKTASIKLKQDRCSRAAASRIHRIQAGEPRTDNPGCALIPPPVAVLTFPPPVREFLTSSREHSSKPHRFCFCKSFHCNFLRLPSTSPQLAKKKPCAFLLTGPPGTAPPEDPRCPRGESPRRSSGRKVGPRSLGRGTARSRMLAGDPRSNPISKAIGGWLAATRSIVTGRRDADVISDVTSP